MNVGIFGGTFDPVHKAHVEIAQLIKDQYNLDKILFIPTGNPPHKVGRRVTLASHRVNMLRLALQGKENFDISCIEVYSDEPSYSVKTLSILRKNNPDDNYYFIIGADSLVYLPDWKDYLTLITMCTFIAVMRPGFSKEICKAAYDKVTKDGATVIMGDFPECDISSTDIRFAFENNLIIDNSQISRYVDPQVYEYIKANNLYKSKEKRRMTIDEMMEDLKLLLSKDRYVHSLGVMNEAVRIARLYGADVEKCRCAGLLHDCAKQLSSAQYKWLGITGSVDPNGVAETRDYDDGGKAARHGRAGAVLASLRYGIDDPEILEAIAVHTTGKPEMSVVAQIIFIADYTEINRGDDKCYQKVREKINVSLMEAIIEECDYTIKHNLKRKDRLLSLDTIKTRNWALSELLKNN